MFVTFQLHPNAWTLTVQISVVKDPLISGLRFEHLRILIGWQIKKVVFVLFEGFLHQPKQS